MTRMGLDINLKNNVCPKEELKQSNKSETWGAMTVD